MAAAAWKRACGIVSAAAEEGSEQLAVTCTGTLLFITGTSAWIRVHSSIVSIGLQTVYTDFQEDKNRTKKSGHFQKQSKTVRVHGLYYIAD